MKIPKEQSEYVNRRKTDNAMAKRKRQTTQWPNEKDRQHNGQKMTKGQTTIYKALHRKLKIEQHEPH